LGVLYNEEPKQVQLNINEDLFQSLMQLAVKAVALTTPVTSIRTEENLDLTVRESNVLALLAKDKTNKEIAMELNLSVANIKATVATLLRKLKVSSRKHAATRARSSGLI
jgi:DNA-binding NarL/FixJ family response regulator